MTRLHKHRLLTVPLALVITAALGCQAVEDDADLLGEDTGSVAAALENDEDGNLGDHDEAPMFGMDAAFEAAELDDEEDVVEEFEDPAIAEETDEMVNRPDTLLAHTMIVWGQFPANREFEEPKNWSGRLAVNRGAIAVRRTIAFERPTDRVLPRRSRLFVDFTSVTGPHHDGLRLTIVDPDPGSDEPQVLTYATEAGVVFQVPVRSLLGDPQRLGGDDLGNSIVAGAIPQAVDACQHGFLGGRWHKLGERGGVLLGHVRGPLGGLRGHMRGIYGVNEAGDRVFFGKYINTDGQFRGIFRGTYRNGNFAGRWLVRSGDVGALGGQYRETAPGPRIAGRFIGRWAETSCDAGN